MLHVHTGLTDAVIVMRCTVQGGNQVATNRWQSTLQAGIQYFVSHHKLLCVNTCKCLKVNEQLCSNAMVKKKYTKKQMKKHNSGRAQWQQRSQQQRNASNMPSTFVALPVL